MGWFRFAVMLGLALLAFSAVGMRPAQAAGQICVGVGGDPTSPADIAAGFLSLTAEDSMTGRSEDCCAAVAALDTEGRASVAATVAGRARIILAADTEAARAQAKAITEAVLSCSHKGFVDAYVVAVQRDPLGCWLGGQCPLEASLLGFGNDGGSGRADLPTNH